MSGITADPQTSLQQGIATGIVECFPEYFGNGMLGLHMRWIDMWCRVVTGEHAHQPVAAAPADLLAQAFLTACCGSAISKSDQERCVSCRVQ